MRKRNCRVKLNKKRFLRSMLLMMLCTLLIVSALSATGNFISSANKIETYTDYQVKNGDTLWQIAEQHNEHYADIREMIYHIQTANQMKSSSIYPGQIIKIPMGE